MKHLYLIVVLLAIGCDIKLTEKKEEKKPLPKNGVVRATFPDGKLKTEMMMKDGKRNGPAKEFYKNGQLAMEIEYKDDVKHGVLRRYYENGTLFKEATYVDGKQDGIEKRYRGNGKLMAEIPYKEDNVCIGLKEYMSSGAERKKYPTIVVKPIDTILKDGKYTIEVSMSDGAKNVEYYRGELLPGGCLSNFMGNIFPGKKKGTGEIVYNLPSGAFVMQEINIVAKVKTAQGNYYITQRKYNVAAENRY